MFIDLRELKKQGKTEESFFFLYEPEHNLSNIPGVEIVSPVKVQGDVCLIGEHSAEINAEIVYTLSGECTNCLEDSKREYVISIAETAGEDSGYEVVNDRIDLGKIVDDAIIMNEPVKFLCKDDCKGICAGCGVNLNHDKCKCRNKEGE